LTLHLGRGCFAPADGSISLSLAVAAAATLGAVPAALAAEAATPKVTGCSERRLGSADASLVERRGGPTAIGTEVL
jgi:hypothetical protein